MCSVLSLSSHGHFNSSLFMFSLFQFHHFYFCQFKFLSLCSSSFPQQVLLYINVCEYGCVSNEKKEQIFFINKIFLEQLQVYGKIQKVQRIPYILFFFFFWPHHAPCGILVPRPGIEPGPTAVKAPRPNHWTTREFPHIFFNPSPHPPFFLLFTSCINKVHWLKLRSQYCYVIIN